MWQQRAMTRSRSLIVSVRYGLIRSNVSEWASIWQVFDKHMRNELTSA
jgi:hypothetical protein